MEVKDNLINKSGLPPELAAKVVAMCQRASSHEEITEDQSMYVPARGSFTQNNTHTFKLEKVLRQKFLEGDNTKVLVLLGESGTGKSLFGLTFIRKLASEYILGDRIPLFIPLPTYREFATGNLIPKFLERMGFTAEEIAILKKTQQFLFLLDAYDELHVTDNFYLTNKLKDWQCKVMISCRTSYLTPYGNYKMFFASYIGEKAEMAKMMELHVAPFNPQQIETYIKQYLKVKYDELQDEISRSPDLHNKWLTPGPYHEAIDKIPDMKQLIRNPFLLRIAMDVLPVVIAKFEQERDQGRRTQMTGDALYTAFVNRWFQRQEEKLVSEQRHPGGSLRKDYEAFAQRLARKMQEKQLTQVTYTEESDLFDDEPSAFTENEWSMFFSDRMIKMDRNDAKRQNRRILSRKGCPLAQVGTDQHAFIHASLISFFSAQLQAKEILSIIVPLARAPAAPVPIAAKAADEDPKQNIITANSGRQYEILKRLTPDLIRKVQEEEGITVVPDPDTGKVVLGKGAFGKFRLVRCVHNGRIGGVKNITGEQEIKASKNEADLQSQLSTQSNLMPIWDFVTIPETPEKGTTYYQFMPLAGYGNGTKFQKNFNAFPFPDTLAKVKFFLHVAREYLIGLCNMHVLSIYHLDLKPDNFVIDKLGKVYIIDFGCAARVDSVKDKHGESMTRGTGDLGYFSPERIANFEERKAKKKDITPFDPAKVDSWAAGLTFLELIVNRKCTGGENIAYELERQFFTLDKGILGELINLATRLLTKDPGKRLTPAQALALPIFQRNDLVLSAKEKKQLFADVYDSSKHIQPEPIKAGSSFSGDMVYRSAIDYSTEAPISSSKGYDHPAALTSGGSGSGYPQFHAKSPKPLPARPSIINNNNNTTPNSGKSAAPPDTDNYVREEDSDSDNSSLDKGL